MAIVAILMISDRAVSQITPDGTLGRERSVVTPNVDINGIFGDRLDGGATRGANLFHSFSGFNIGEGGRVYFANPTGIENIFSRVTGNTVSQILGTLGVNGNANLYFLNPNGIIFGRNARLDIRGSFIATTAERFVFNNGTQFSATNPESPLLTMSVPVGLQYGIGRGTITNQGILAVGQDLILSATNLTLSGQLYAGRDLKLQAQDTIQIRDSVTNPFIAYAGNDLDIQGNQSIDIFALNHPNTIIQSGRNLTLISDGIISTDAHFSSGNNFSILNLSSTPANLISLYDPGITVGGDYMSGTYTGASLKVVAGGNITFTGNIRINAISPTGSISITDPDYNTLTTSLALILRAGGNIDVAGRIDTGTTLGQDGGSVILEAVGNINVTEGISSSAVAVTNNDGGDITITSTGGSLNIGADPINNNSFDTGAGGGNAGNITIRARDNITIAGDITAYIVSTGGGNGGDINITSTQGGINTLAGDINTGFFSQNSGTVTLDAAGNIITGGIITKMDDTNVTGNSGSITLISRNGGINTSAGDINTGFFSQNSGTVTLDAAGNIITGGITTKMDDTNLISNSGSITLISRNGGIDTRGGQLLTISGSFINGNGGAVNLNAYGNISTGDIWSFSGGTPASRGNAGNITLSSTSGSINTLDALLDAGANLGNGGNITLTARNDITVSKISSYVVNSGGGNAGNITLTSTAGAIDTSADVVYSNSVAQSGSAIVLNAFGNITTGALNASGQLDGGSIELTSRRGNINTRGDLNSSSQTGNGGAIALNTNTGNIRTGNINSSANFQGGNISLRSNSGIINTTAGTLNSSSQAGLGGATTINTDNNINTGNISSGGGSITLNSNSNINTTAGVLDSSSQIGNGGDIALTTTNGNLMVGDVQSNSSLNSGSISFTNPTGTISLTGEINSSADQNGNGGDITITTGRFELQGGTISANTAGAGIGQAGSFTINASESFTMRDGATLSFSSKSINGEGSILLNAPIVSILNGSRLLVSTFGTNQSGSLIVNAHESFQVSGFSSGVLFDTTTDNIAGGLSIDTSLLEVNEGGQIINTTRGVGNGANLRIEANSIEVSDPASGLSFNMRGSGDASGMRIGILEAGQLTIRDGAEVSVSGQGTGNAGDLSITADSIFMDNSGRIEAETESGRGGNIQLRLYNPEVSLLMRHGSEISTAARGTGDGGNINIDANGFIFAILSEDSDIIANASSGKGGSIDATAPGIFGFRLYENVDTSESDFTASSEFGIDGTVVLNTLDKPQPDTLPNDFQGEDLDTRCQAGSNPQGRSSFVATGDGGLPTNPDYGMSNDAVEVGLVSPVPSSDSRREIPTTEANLSNLPRQPIEEAQGWVIDGEGNVSLVGETATPIPQSPSLPTASCQFTQRP